MSQKNAKKKKRTKEVDCGRGQISMTIRFRERGLEIWSNSCWCPTGGDGWLDTIQLWSLTGPIIPTTAPCKSPPNIPPSPVVETLAVVSLRVNPAAAICIWEARGKVGNRERALMMALAKCEEEISICCLTAGHWLVVLDLFYSTYQHVDGIFAKKQLNMEKKSKK